MASWIYFDFSHMLDSEAGNSFKEQILVCASGLFPGDDGNTKIWSNWQL